MSADVNVGPGLAWCFPKVPLGEFWVVPAVDVSQAF